MERDYFMGDDEGHNSDYPSHHLIGDRNHQQVKILNPIVRVQDNGDYRL